MCAHSAIFIKTLVKQQFDVIRDIQIHNVRLEAFALWLIGLILKSLLLLQAKDTAST